jgi:glycosyltransferase involved in cell wall biosynthesis
VVVGDGPEMRRLKRLAGPTISFTGRVTDAEVATVLRSSRALVVTATEEFGIAAVEAQASGRPVIALAEGGVLESVIDGRTGVFYERNDPGALAAAVAAFDPMAVDPAACVASAERFGIRPFQAELARVVAQARSDARVPRPEERPAGVLAAGLLPRHGRRTSRRSEPKRAAGA